MSIAPTLTTERLTLRHHRHADFEPMAKHFATDWAQYMDGPITANELWKWLGAEIVSWDWLGHGSWAIDLKDSGDFIGQVGLIKPPKFPEVELGWCLFPGNEGHGFAYEAALAARAWGFENIEGLETLVSYIDPGNARSLALATRLGATHDETAALPDGESVGETLVYRHRRLQ